MNGFRSAQSCHLLQFTQRERRRARQRTPFGDEDVQVVFAGMGISSVFQRRFGSNRRTALFYHTDMLNHANWLHENCPECPDRLKIAYQRCSEFGLVDRCLLIQPQPISDELLRLAHTQDYIDAVAATVEMSDDARFEYVKRFDSAFFNKDTHTAARLAAGALTHAVDVVTRGDTRNAFCLVRPPGHHAMKDEPCGYCVFNNVEIAAKHALRQHEANRILIVDWDIHHGQAMQYAFYDDPRVLYFSIHRYDQGNYWPSLRESDYDFVGQGPSYGYNINKDYSDIDYLTIFNILLMPIAYEFGPDLVIVSAGYDCALGCPYGCFSLSPAVFAHLTNRLMVLADGNVIVALEGGYNVESLSDGVAHTISALLGDPLPSLESLKPVLSGTKEAIRKCVSVLRTKWKSLNIFPIKQALSPKDMSGLSTNTWKTVMVPTTDVEPCRRSEDEVAAANKKLADLRRICSFTEMTDQQRACLVYDSRMENHKSELERQQPECPARTRRAYELLEEYGLARRCKRTEARVASEEELLRIHSQEYIDALKNTATMPQAAINEFAERFQSHTYDSASLAAGSLLSVVDDICSGEALHGVAVIRPPGHHAEYDRCMGFCFFNNVALAVRHAQESHGLKKIAVIDWDIHHGNGLQHIFEMDPNLPMAIDLAFHDFSVLCLSIHRFDEGRYFPNSPDADTAFCGDGEGVGKTVNIPWNGGGVGISMECFGHLTHLLVATSTLNNPVEAETERRRRGVILALEGGYNLTATAEGLSHCVATLLSDTCLRLPSGLAPTDKGAATIRRVVEVQKNHWTSLFDYSPMACHLDQLTNTRLQAVTTSSITAATPTTQASTENHTGTEATVAATTNVATGVSFDSTSSASLFSPYVSLSTTTIQAELSIPAAQEVVMAFEAPQPASPPPANSDADSNSQEVASSQPQQHPTTSATAATVSDLSMGAVPLSDTPQPVAGPSAERSTNRVDSGMLRQLVHFADAGIEDLGSFLGLNSSDPTPNRLFAVEPILWCPHLGQVTSASQWRPEVTHPCTRCESRHENWVCLTCYEVYCGRYAQGHMLEHYNTTQHSIVLSLADLSAWCYVCNSYIHNERRNKHSIWPNSEWLCLLDFQFRHRVLEVRPQDVFHLYC
ncbi:Histone deacetylase 6 [Echinococcus granulosus]|uniref:Histone deacetylase 6 n=1 Tax=Echinococcus granulosus TaxID=6210 RepID=W6U9E7_ECHGR|nr:Histone deacetylase 6 [Echinococcus granulosus]EUB57988.1 Histone deacetylase 6 [Echinococcus granulosus]